MRSLPDIVISGMGVSCAVGTGCDALWDALAAGRDGLRAVERFRVTEFAAQIAGLWPQWDATAPEACSAVELATASAKEACANARITQTGHRVALILGTCFAENYGGFSELAQKVAQAIGATGPCLTVSTACSSSTTAIGLARDLLEEGSADVVIAGGVDVLTRQVFAGFHAIGALSSAKCAPFGEPAGMTLGEGAGFVVLETRENARARGIEPVSHVLGYGLSADAHHETSPDPSGSGVVRAIRSALADAQVPPAQIDFVSAHGTGTESNDAAEWLAVRTALTHEPPISSTKSFLGHAQGAAGVLELIALLLCMQRGRVPGTLRATPGRARAPKDPVNDKQPRALRVRSALKLSAAFAGANAALVIGREAMRRQSPERRAICVRGLGVVSPCGLDLCALEAALAAGQPMMGAVQPFDLSAIVRSAPSRDIDPSAQYATAAVSLALADAKLTVRGSQRDRSGIFTGNTRMPARSANDCVTSMDRRGITGIAAGPFTRMVLNAPAGTCAKLLSLKGPLLVLSAGRSSGLLAIIRASQHLASRRCADLIVAGGLDELPVTLGELCAEGAAFAALTADESPSPVRIDGWGLAGPNDAATAVSRALVGSPEIDGVFSAMPSAARLLVGTAADPAHLPLGLTDVHAFAGAAQAASSAFAFVLAASRVRRGSARRLLVVTSSDSISCAAVVAAPGA